MKFCDFGLDEAILRNLEEMGFNKPTDIQYKAIRPILRGEDVLAIAQTGTGKTAAFAIPVLHQIFHKKRRSEKDIRCVVMEPTHELALQIGEVIQQISKHLKISILPLIGGVKQDPQIEKLERGVDILIATPGRLFDLVSQGHLDLSNVETLVLDEADHMLDMGFIRDIRDLIRFLPRGRQTLFFSATITPEIKKLAYSLVTNPIRIQISPKNPVSKNVTHTLVHVEMDDKRFFLERIFRENPESRIIVFVRTKVRAERVLKAMERIGIEAVTMHSDKEQKERLVALNRFKTGEVHMLIATDVSARGIDIPSVDYVVNYDLPDEPQNYVHRVGRTGRGMQKGFAVSFCAPEEAEALAEIEKYIGDSITITDIDKQTYNETIDFSDANQETDWQSLIDEEENWLKKSKKGKKK